MSTERFSTMTLKGLYHNFDELWIAQQPSLFIVYLTQYFPRLAYFVVTNFLTRLQYKSYNAGLEYQKRKLSSDQPIKSSN